MCFQLQPSAYINELWNFLHTSERELLQNILSVASNYHRIGEFVLNVSKGQLFSNTTLNEGMYIL